MAIDVVSCLIRVTALKLAMDVVGPPLGAAWPGQAPALQRRFHDFWVFANWRTWATALEMSPLLSQGGGIASWFPGARLQTGMAGSHGSCSHP